MAQWPENPLATSPLGYSAICQATSPLRYSATLMDLLILFGVGFSTGLSGAMIPGPLTLYVVSEAFRQGQTAGLKVAAGHLLLEAGFAALIVLGLRDLLSTALFRAAVVWVGGIGLVVMGGLLLRQLPRLSLVSARPSDHVGASGQRAEGHPGEGERGRDRGAFRGGPIAGGAFFSLTSPGFLIWWATIGTSVLLEGSLAGVPGITMVASGHALADLLWCWFVAFSVERGRAYCSDRTYRTIIGLIALCLIVLGVGLLLKP